MTNATATSTDYSCEPQQRLLRLLLLLAGHEIHGLAPAQIAKDMACSASVVTRDMANLQQAGWAERVPATGCWRLSPTPVQLGLRHQVAMGRAEALLEQTRSRYSRGIDN
jgi:DNA-binding IclR family transcriptional regulator